MGANQMKFTLVSAGKLFNSVRPEMQSLGFVFAKYGDGYRLENSTVEIEINSLEQLVELRNQVGDLIIQSGHYIKIYNDFIE